MIKEGNINMNHYFTEFNKREDLLLSLQEFNQLFSMYVAARPNLLAGIIQHYDRKFEVVTVIKDDEVITIL